MTDTPETPEKTDEIPTGSKPKPASDTRNEPTPQEIEAAAFAPGWEKEHAVDYSGYLDALLDDEKPLNEVAVKTSISPDSERPTLRRSSMRDVKLFRTSGNGVDELVSTGHALEKDQQSFIEKNMEAFLGVRFLASDYSTGPVHGGRIGSLGLDENNSPVIIEYKRSKNDNAITQGLFYVDWLMDHRAEFTVLVTNRFGSETKDLIDWANPRLLCIAHDFTRYDKHTGWMLNLNIELLRYRRYGDELLLFELVNAVQASGNGQTAKPNKGASPVVYKTVDQYLKDASENLTSLYESLTDLLFGLGDDIQEKHLKYYIAFKRLKNFACVEIHAASEEILLFLKINPDTIELREGFSRDVRKVGHYGTGDLEVRLRTFADIEAARPLIELSYEAS